MKGGRIILSCGGYQSGSTLLYKLTGEYAERTNTGRRIGFVDSPQVALLHEVWCFVEALGVSVAKCHLAPGTDERSKAWLRLHDDGQMVAVYTIRDWRDVVHSWSRKFQMTVDEVFEYPRWACNLASMESWLAEGRTQSLRSRSWLGGHACLSMTRRSPLL